MNSKIPMSYWPRPCMVNKTLTFSLFIMVLFKTEIFSKITVKNITKIMALSFLLFYFCIITTLKIKLFYGLNCVPNDNDKLQIVFLLLENVYSLKLTIHL